MDPIFALSIFLGCMPMTCVKKTTDRSSTGSHQKIVDAAPPQAKLPVEPCSPASTADFTTEKPRPKPPAPHRTAIAAHDEAPTVRAEAEAEAQPQAETEVRTGQVVFNIICRQS